MQGTRAPCSALASTGGRRASRRCCVRRGRPTASGQAGAARAEVPWSVGIGRGMKGTQFAQFSSEVLWRGAAAVLPQHLPDRWLDALLEEADLFAPGEPDPEEGHHVEDCCAGLLGAVFVLLMAQRGLHPSWRLPPVRSCAPSTPTSWRSPPNVSAATRTSGWNPRRWRIFLMRNARCVPCAAPPRGLKCQPSKGSLSSLVLRACMTISILEVEWRVLWKVSPRSWGFLHNGDHAELGMNAVMPSTRSCRVMHAHQDVATILCVLARHDPEVRKPWPHVRHKQEILSQEV